jgi:hypothetical protein
MTITLGTITLPEDLWWADETEWTPVEQDQGWSITGAVLLDVSTKLAGRPITLVGDDSTAWASRQTVLDLMAQAALPGQQLTLTFHDRSFQVVFRHSDGKPIEAEAVVRITPPAATDYYILTALRLLAVE